MLLTLRSSGDDYTEIEIMGDGTMRVLWKDTRTGRTATNRVPIYKVPLTKKFFDIAAKLMEEYRNQGTQVLVKQED